MLLLPKLFLFYFRARDMQILDFNGQLLQAFLLPYKIFFFCSLHLKTYVSKEGF